MIFRKQREKYLDTELNIEAIDTRDTEIKMTTPEGTIFWAFWESLQ